MSILKKIFSIIPNGISGLLGILQAFIKFGKEVCTLAIDILSPIIPNAQFKIVVEKIRGIFNTVDRWIEAVKQLLLNIND